MTTLGNLPKRRVYVFRRGKLKHFSEGDRRYLKKIAYRLDEPGVKRYTFKVYRDYVGTGVSTRSRVPRAW